MCKSIDAAITIVNKSIKLVHDTDDRNYYMDYIKLHKLLFIAQCRALEHYDTTLFGEDIQMYRCGPMVLGLDLIPGKCGFDLITWRLDPKAFGTIDVPITFLRGKAIDDVLEKFGTYSTEKIVSMLKQTEVFKKYLHNIEEHRTISKTDLCDAGFELFK